MRSEPGTPQFPYILMSSQLGFCAGVFPDNQANRGKSQKFERRSSTRVSTHVETHDATFSWRVRAMTIECVFSHPLWNARQIL